ncbi:MULTISPECIES: LuxR C-terminal-related transcriptional regulator [unclassified Parafrankia]|uniref:LuxR C-terminal-related transcriptional regulator n=1 Tax=unclassified Parafrankia TaxID=2994368 RepID=UPI000DA469A6|nr:MULTISPECIES: LuxR C-terminal-related transcriptional regulator [unclassified Parafrankia]TCJ32613.1 LuxR family transcriptional regulator [Parafrankia sp. BMG5.11]CAI7976487.1 LuxR family transcriptional regulator [Frankia sp. Hr75.2]SQD98051.1 Transcriptional regulator, LuxR family [Parafrankia sp. Ea1.12]
MPAPPRFSNEGLPAELTSFVGRQAERAELRRLLGGSRLVTLVGAGGVGKTRLALRAAADVRDAFPDGVWWVELAQLRDPGLLAHLVSATFGCPPPTDQSVLETLRGHLAQKQLLILLDNCEHLADACADLVDSLLRGCPGLRILATSRESLRIDSESTYVVAPFPVPAETDLDGVDVSGCDAVTLFLERARAVRSGFDLTRDNRAAVWGICRLVDGIPLAIELAAVKIRALLPADVLRLLTENTRILRRDGRRVPERQRTLRACIDWSFELCTGPEQRLWTQLSVFSGGFELDAAEGVCGASGLAEPVLDLILSLVDKSILTLEAGPENARFRLLEMLRQYGQERLESSGEEAALRRAHRDWFLDLSTRAEAGLLGADRRAWLSRLRRDHANLQRAMEYCAETNDHGRGLALAGSLHRYWVADGRFDEGRTWLARFLDHGGGSIHDRIRAVHAAGWLATLQGDPTASARILRQGADLVSETHDLSASALIIQLGGMDALYTGRSGAIDHLEQALAQFRVAGDINRQLETLALLTVAAALSATPETARAYHAECAEIAELQHDPCLRSYTAWAYAVATWRAGDPEAALSIARDALSATSSRSDQLSLTLCLEAIAWIEASRGRHATTAVLLGTADRLWARMGTSTTAFPGLFRFRRESEADSRRVLGHHAFDAIWTRGTELSLEGACACGLGDVEITPSATATVDADGQPAPVIGVAAGDRLAAAGLTRRERQVAGLVAQGLTNKEIAARLVISLRTVETHVQQVLTKLGFHSRGKVASWLAGQHAGGT